MRSIVQHTAFFISVMAMLNCAAQTARPTLAEIIDSALTNDYILMNQRVDITQSELDRQQLKDAHQPRLQISGANELTLTAISLRTNEIEIPSLDLHINGSTNLFTLTADRLKVGADAKMLIYSGRVAPLKRSAEEKIRAQSLLTEKQKQDIISKVVAIYDQLALLRQARIVLDESERRLAENIRVADKAFQYGLITKYEKQKIEVAKAQLAYKVEEYEGNRTVVLDQLTLITGIPRERLLLINSDLQPLVNEKTKNSVENRPDARAYDAMIIAQQFKVRAEKTWRLPKVQAQASLGYMGSYFGHLKSSKPVLPNGSRLSVDLRTLQIAPVASIGIAFSWDLFDGRDGKRDIQRAKNELTKTTNSKADLIRQLEINLAKTTTDYAVRFAQIDTRRNQQTIARNALTQATQEFRTGLIRATELIGAEEDLRQAALDLLQAIYDQRRAAIESLKATGDLTNQSLR